MGCTRVAPETGPEEALKRLISSCNRCSPIGRPFVKYGAYTWLPEDVKILAVVESPPPGSKESFLYNLDYFDQLRVSLGVILGVDPDIKVLRALNDRSIFITDAVKCRPSSAGDIKEMRENCKHLLKHEVDLLGPEKILAMGRAASLSISSIFGIKASESLEGFTEVVSNEATVIFTPHPNYILRISAHI